MMRWFGFLLVILSLVGCSTSPVEYREPAPLSASERAKLNLRVFDQVWVLVNDKYFDAKFRGVDWKAMEVKYRPEAENAPDELVLYAVLNRMCGELKESHLHAFSPRRAYEERTEFRAAVGIQMLEIDGLMVVHAVLPGSPAEQAGVKPGWVVVSRDGVLWEKGATFVSHVGQPIVIEFLDENDQTRKFTIVPKLLNFDQLEARELGDGYFYLRFDNFGQESLSWLSKQLKEHAKSEGVVIDLRYNPGGYALALSVALAEFFPQGLFHPVLEGQWIKRNGKHDDAKTIAWGSAHYAGRVVILTGPSTGSSAEIFSHVLQYYHRAWVVGHKTAGAVINSRRYSLADGGSLQVPVEDYIGLDGQRLEGRGVTPDHVLPALTLADLRSKEDVGLKVALEILHKAPPPQFPPTTEPARIR